MGARYGLILPHSVQLLTTFIVLKDIEREDELWNEARRKPIRRSQEPTTMEPSVSESSTIPDTKQEVERPKMKSNAPRGFY